MRNYANLDSIYFLKILSLKQKHVKLIFSGDSMRELDSKVGKNKSKTLKKILNFFVCTLSQFVY